MNWKTIIESKIEAQVMSRLKNEEDSEYQKFFQTVLKKFKVDSPADLDDAGKKKFFDYIEYFLCIDADTAWFCNFCFHPLNKRKLIISR